MNAVVMGLTLRGLLGRRRSLLLVILPVLLLLLAALIRWASDGEVEGTVFLAGNFAMGTLLPLMCLLIGTGVIGSEIDDGSIVYLLAKPVPRRTILLSKLVIAWGAALVFAVLPIVAAVEIAGDDGGRLGTAYGVAAALAAITYTAIFVALSVVTRNAVIIGLLYALLWETVLGGYVPGVRNVSVRQWALAAAEHGLPEQGVEQADDHRVPGDDREGHEDRGVGDGRKGGGDAVRGAEAPAVVPGDLDRGDDRQHGEDQGSAPGDDQLRPEDGASRDGLGEQVDDRSVVDLRPDYPGADQQAHQRQEG